MSHFLRWMGVLCLVALLGCQSPPTRMELTVFDEDGTAHRHYADFAEAYYRLLPGGRLEVVMASESPSSVDPTQSIEQTVYARTFWRPQPGKTYAEASQVNAHLQYAILTLPTGVRYDGGAFISYHLQKKTGRLIGKIESASVAPRFRLGDVTEPFGPARVTATFTATEDPGRVVEAIRLLETRFQKSGSTPAEMRNR